MSVLLETSAGDLVIDLLVDYSQELCENFLKLCKIKYYNFAPIHSIQKNYAFQTGDPLGPLSPESNGGSCIKGLLPSADGKPKARAFPVTFNPALKHAERGTVSMATVALSDEDDAQRVAGSQFLITLSDETADLDERGAIFGKVVEGFDVLEKINEAITDTKGHPLVDIRILHTIILEDPYDDPEGLDTLVPPASPAPTPAQLATVRIASVDDLKQDEELDEETVEKRRREREARAQALTLEMMGDLPFADVKPPENVLFVCKLNPVTTSADLELIFSRFGKIISCEVICDGTTGDSLQYAFIEFDDKESCERAYFKMQDVLVDDRRIHVDFSQSVSKLSDAWRDSANKKRRTGRGGWGGVDGLEKRRQYRNQRDDDEMGGSYDYVHGREEHSQRDGPPADRRNHSRSRSPKRESGRDRERDRDSHRDRRRRDDGRRRERERERDRDGDRDRRERDRDRDRHGRSGHGSTRQRSRERDYDRDRRRDRDRDYDRRRDRR